VSWHELTCCRLGGALSQALKTANRLSPMLIYLKKVTKDMAKNSLNDGFFKTIHKKA
jgi:hypothetical protein